MALNSCLILSILFHAFPFYPGYPCFSGAFIFWKNKKGFVSVIFTKSYYNYKLRTKTCCLKKSLTFIKSIIKNKKIKKKKKKKSRDLSFNRKTLSEKIGFS